MKERIDERHAVQGHPCKCVPSFDQYFLYDPLWVCEGVTTIAEQPNDNCVTVDYTDVVQLLYKENDYKGGK